MVVTTLGAAAVGDRAVDRDERGQFGLVELEEPGREQRPAGAGRGQAGLLDPAVDLAEDVGAPGPGLLDGYCAPNGQGACGRDRAELDLRADRWRLEQRPQAGHAHLQLGQLGFHRVQVRDDLLGPGLYVRRGQDGPDLVQRHVQVAEPADDLGHRHLAGVVEPVAARRVDPGGLEQPLVVVEAQGLDAEMRHAGEVADRHQDAHRYRINLPLAGESTGLPSA